ncbi:MAG: hypothetical protein IJR66_02310 [Clostridia bacterium]|nr:hypothetical protein [Clostridia bacterium]
MATMLIITSVFAVGCKTTNTNIDLENSIDEISESISSPKTTKVQSVKVSLSSVKSFSLTEESPAYIEKEIHATVLPESASNKAVDYTVAWGDGATHSIEDVSEYVTVTPFFDGSTDAYVRCFKKFDSDTINITCTTRQGGKTATCSCTYVGLATNIEIVPIDNNGNIATLTSSADRGDYYVLNSNSEYKFQVNLSNALGEESISSNLSRTSGIVGSAYMTPNYAVSNDYGATGTFMSGNGEICIRQENFNYNNSNVDADQSRKQMATGEQVYNQMILTQRNLNLYRTRFFNEYFNANDKLITISATRTVENSYINNGTLNLETPGDNWDGDKCLQAKLAYLGGTSGKPDQWGTMTKINDYIPVNTTFINLSDDNYATYISGEQRYGDASIRLSHNFSAGGKNYSFYSYKCPDNTPLLNASYMYVTVTDSISNLSETIKFWIVEGVSSVSLNSITF